MGGEYNFTLLINDFWYAAEFLAKMGYGDFIPSTLWGKLVVVIGILFGSLWVSLGFVVLINLLELSAHEKLALSLIETLRTQQSIKNSAASIIALLFKINALCKKDPAGLTYMERRNLDILVDALKVEILNFKRLER